VATSRGPQRRSREAPADGRLAAQRLLEAAALPTADAAGLQLANHTDMLATERSLQHRNVCLRRRAAQLDVEGRDGQ
jgi:hypothetical protein